MTYDDLGRLLTRSHLDNPSADTEYLTYSARGLVAYTNQLGFTNGYTYDAAGRKTAETNANGEATLFGYNPAGDLLTLTDGKNQTTTWGYDPYGRVTNKLDHASAVIFRYAYDPNNRLTNRWTPAKGTTAYTYDAVGNLTSVQYPASSNISFYYDALNRVTDMVDGLGTTHYTYDAAGQLLTEGGLFASDTVTNTYSNRRRVALALQQPNGSVWTYGFGWDAANWLTNVTSPAGVFAYAYTTLDGNFSGRLVQQLSLPTGGYITNAFDPVARLLDTVLNNSANSPLDAAHYGYDAGNRRTAYTNAAEAYVHYTYDPIGQLKVGDSSVNSEDRGYAYDAAWNLHYRTNNGSPQTFGVDVKNQLTNTPSGSCAYDANGNLTSNAGWLYGYDDENRLTSWSQGGPGAGALATAFAYDGRGRLRTRAEYQGDGSQWVLQGVVNYLYDGMRVIQERDGDNWPQVAYTRGLDLSGTLEGAGGIGGLLARSHDFTNCHNTITYWLTNNSGYCITNLAIWDDYGTYVENVSIDSGQTWSYSFPGVPGRTYYVWGDSCDYYYIQIYEDIFTGTLETHRVEFVDGGEWNCSEGANCVTESGYPLCDASSSGRWLTHNYYHADGNGNIACLIDSNQTVVASYRYDPFGNTVSQSGGLADANVYRFSSKEIHAASGMYYYGYRFYDPSLQRWVNRDPVQELDGPNLYEFVANNPVSRCDPAGLWDRDTFPWWFPHPTPLPTKSNQPPALPRPPSGSNCPVICLIVSNNTALNGTQTHPPAIPYPLPVWWKPPGGGRPEENPMAQEWRVFCFTNFNYTNQPAPTNTIPPPFTNFPSPVTFP